MNNNKPKLVTDDIGTKRWYLNGELHREDGPAVIYLSGTKEWCLNGKRHREDEPAIIHPDGTKYWFLNGKCHREDGPAMIYPSGSKYWWLNDKRYTYEDWFNLLTPEQQINFLWNLNE